MSAEKCTTTTTADNTFSQPIKWYGNSSFCLIIKGHWLKQKNATVSPPEIINSYYLWIRHMVRRFKFWLHFKGLEVWS